jgi:hypothetical protein
MKASRENAKKAAEIMSRRVLAPDSESRVEEQDFLVLFLDTCVATLPSERELTKEERRRDVEEAARRGYEDAGS